MAAHPHAESACRDLLQALDIDCRRSANVKVVKNAQKTADAANR